VAHAKNRKHAEGARNTHARGDLSGSRMVNGVALIASRGDVTSPTITWGFASLVASV
jgi:hypothetical protein